MPTTPNYAFPYPSLSDPPDGAAQIQALAQGVDTSLASTDSDVVAIDSRVSTLEDNTTYGAWLAPTLQNGWVPRVDFQAPGYRLAPGGRVELVGTIISGTTASGTLLFTLPIGFRPDAQTSAPLLLNSAETAGVVVRTTGAVELFIPSSAAAFTAATFTGGFVLSAA